MVVEFIKCKVLYLKNSHVIDIEYDINAKDMSKFYKLSLISLFDIIASVCVKQLWSPNKPDKPREVGLQYFGIFSGHRDTAEDWWSQINMHLLWRVAYSF